MARKMSKEDIIKAIDLDDSNEKLKEILGSDSGSDIDFLPYSSSSNSDMESDKFNPLSILKKRKKKTKHVQKSKQIKLSNINGNCISVHKGKKSFLEKKFESVHEGTKQHICDKCSAMFVIKNDFEMHVATVHEKQNKCDKCNASFLKKIDFDNHIASVHEGKKQLKCEICNACFLQECDFDKHIILVHKGKRPDFDKNIASVHEGKKQFKCDACSACFLQQSDFDKHIELVHEGKRLDFDMNIASVHEGKISEVPKTPKTPKLTKSVKINTPKSTRKYLVLADQLEIIKQIDAGRKYADIGRERNMNEASVRTVYKRKDKILSQVAVTNPSNLKTIHMSRSRILEKTEKLLALWILDLEQRGQPVGKSQIQTKARSLHSHIKANLDDCTDKESRETFSASNGWFERFKDRQEVQNVKLLGEAKSADLEAAKSYPPKLQKIIDEGGYSESQIFNVDEAGLWWKQAPTRSFVVNSGTSTKAGTKVPKARCTLLVGSNALGTHRLKPLVIGKSENPRCFKNAGPLPLHYRNNSKSWMTGSIWKDWFYRIFCPSMKVYCDRNNLAFKILLLVDNCPAHPYLEHENVKMHFLPPNTTSVLQPMDQGAISILKTNFKYKLLEAALKDGEGKTRPFTDFLKGLTILDAMKWVEKSWHEIPEKALRGIWNKVLLSRLQKPFEPEIDEKIDQIVTFGKSLGMDEIDSKQVKASLSVEAEALTDQDLVDLDNDLKNVENETGTDQVIAEANSKPAGLKKEIISEIIQCLTRATELATEFDIDYERSHVFQNGIKTFAKPYQTLLKLESEKCKQQREISSFFSKQVPEKETSIHLTKKKDKSCSKIASLFSKQLAKTEKTNNVKKSLEFEVVSVHEGKSQHICDMCNAMFFKKIDFEKHVAAVHEGEHKCSKCGTSFPEKKDYDNHIESVHEGKKQHKCDICNASFEQQQDFDKHITLMHEGKKPQNEIRKKSVDVEVEESSHEHAVKICSNCEDLATFFCKSCDENLCKCCIIIHYKNKDFRKNHDMIPL